MRSSGWMMKEELHPGPCSPRGRLQTDGPNQAQSSPASDARLGLRAERVGTGGVAGGAGAVLESAVQALGLSGMGMESGLVLLVPRVAISQPVQVQVQVPLPLPLPLPLPEWAGQVLMAMMAMLLVLAAAMMGAPPPRAPPPRPPSHPWSLCAEPGRRHHLHGDGPRRRSRRRSRQARRPDDRTGSSHGSRARPTRARRPRRTCCRLGVRLLARAGGGAKIVTHSRRLTIEHVQARHY